MSQLRVEKVQELMKQEISSIILRELKDPRIGFVTVTSVECTGDLREAKVYVSLMGSDQQVKDCWQGLQSSLGFIRREIGKRIRLRSPRKSASWWTSLWTIAPISRNCC